VHTQELTLAGLLGSTHWSPCVIVADDEPGIQSLIQTKLRQASMCVHTVGNGDDLLTTLRLIPVDLVILDIVMPGRSGLSVLEEMGADPAMKNVPVILVTARGGDRTVAAGYRAGAIDYVTKPFSPQDLLERVIQVLGRR
jgi:two-component system phosphate regulon response regulator PhoB